MSVLHKCRKKIIKVRKHLNLHAIPHGQKRTNLTLKNLSTLNLKDITTRKNFTSYHYSTITTTYYPKVKKADLKVA